MAQTIRELEGIDNDTRAALLELVNRKKYGLVWEEHPEDVEERLREQLPVLEEDRALALTDGGKEAPNHVLIEGDNLEALTALTYTHEGKIDVVAIDPPYNTGEKDDFVYNDAYVDSEDRYRHSKWISFINKRIKIAHKLLKSSGVMFVHIDDNEVAQLKVICDEIFHSRGNQKKSNCLGILVWDLGTGTQAGHFTRSHEYILAYVKNREELPNFSGGEGNIDHSALKKISKKNPPVEFTFKAGTVFMAKDGTELFNQWGGSEKTELISGRMVAENNKLKYDVTLKAGFAMISQMKSWFSGEYTIDSKGQHVTSFYFNSSGVLHYTKERSIINPASVISHVGSTKSGTSELADIIGNTDLFKYPKPLQLIQFLLSLKSTNSVILDFFAGSGTTLHATMQLNKEDGGHRQCILVQGIENDEKTKEDKKIAREVTYERNKRVIQGYTTPKGVQVEGLGHNNLRYYRTKLLPRDTGLAAQRRLMEAATELLCIKHDVYEECTMLGGLRLKPRLCRYFADEGKAGMLIIYRTEAIGRLVEEIKTLPEDAELLVYVFSLDSYAMDADFEEVADRVTLCALPRAIYNAYQKVLPKKGRRQELPPLATSDENTQLTIEEGGEA